MARPHLVSFSILSSESFFVIKNLFILDSLYLQTFFFLFKTANIYSFKKCKSYFYLLKKNLLEEPKKSLKKKGLFDIEYSYLGKSILYKYSDSFPESSFVTLLTSFSPLVSFFSL